MRISDWSSDVCSSDLQDWTEHKALWDRLDAIKARIPAMTLVTTAQHKGADAIGAAWAAARGVPLVAFRLNRKLGNRAAFERNRSIQRLLPDEAGICEGRDGQTIGRASCRERVCPYV